MYDICSLKLHDLDYILVCVLLHFAYSVERLPFSRGAIRGVNMVCTQISASLATLCFVCTDEKLMYSSDWTQLHTDTALLLMRGLTSVRYSCSVTDYYQVRLNSPV
jgi:hypothetical protein